MKNKKLTFTWCAFAVLCLIALGFMLLKIFDSVIWCAWFASFDGWLGIYCFANVKQKEVISKNYNQELDDRRKDSGCA